MRVIHAAKTAAAGNVDDAPLTLRQHHGQCRVAKVKHGIEVDAQYFAPLFIGGIFEGCHRAWVFHTIVPADAGIVHQADQTPVRAGASDQFICRFRQPDIPGYRDWLWQQDITETYETYRKILQHLQWHCARDRWVLKAPTHLRTLDPLLAVFPDACIVQNHRDPLLSLASVISLRITMLKPAVAEIDMPRLTRWISEDNAEWLQRGLETRQRIDQEERFFSPPLPV